MKILCAGQQYLTKRNDSDELMQYADQLRQYLYDDPELMHISYYKYGVGYPNVKVLANGIRCIFVHVEHEKYAVDSIYNTRITKQDETYLNQLVEDILEEFPEFEIKDPLHSTYIGRSTIGLVVVFSVRSESIH